jgi:hypothetical protein
MRSKRFGLRTEQACAGGGLRPSADSVSRSSYLSCKVDGVSWATGYDGVKVNHVLPDKGIGAQTAFCE